MTDEAAFGPADFARALYGDALDGARRAVVWAKGSGAVWCASPADVAAAALSRRGTHDVYLGACLQRADAETPGGRGKADTAACLPGVWVDVDCEDAGHKAGNLPPSVTEALAHLAARVPQPPTLAILTGGGVHLWWLLDEPWLLDTDADRAGAASLVARWQARVRAAWAERGWRLDPTQDLARVMRIPGTWNRKREPARPVSLHYIRDARHAPSDLLDGCPAETPRAQAAAPVSGDGLMIDANRSPPVEKFSALCELDGPFKLTWLRKRKDLQDQSQSGYDFALMARALRAGWSDQEIVDLCVAHRRTGGQPPKRLDYYTASLGRARQSAGRFEAEAESQQTRSEATERLLDTAATAPAVIVGDIRAGVLADLREALGLPVVGLQKHLLDPPTWDILLDGPIRVVKLGGVEWATRHGTFRARVAEALDVLPPAMKPAKWEPVAQLMLKLAEHVTYQDVAEASGLIEGLVRDYLRGHSPSRDLADAADRGHPIVRDNRVGIVLTHFRGWLDRCEGEKMTRGKLVAALKRGGWESSAVNYAADHERRTSRLFWMAPKPWPWPLLPATPTVAKSDADDSEDSERSDAASIGGSSAFFSKAPESNSYDAM